MTRLTIRAKNWLVLMVIVCSSALLENSYPLRTVSSQSEGCSITLDTAAEAQLDPAYGGTSAGTISLAPGTAIEFVGRTPDRSAWIIRHDEGYALLPSDSSVRPVGCDVALWGAPAPDYRALDEVISAAGLAAWHDAGFLGQGILGRRD